jgi:hypothetical protein
VLLLDAAPAIWARRGTAMARDDTPATIPKVNFFIVREGKEIRSRQCEYRRGALRGD